MSRNHLATVDAVVDALGGTRVVAGKIGVVISAVSNWRLADKFPPNTFLLFKLELRKIRKTAPASLWSMRVAEVSS